MKKFNFSKLFFVAALVASFVMLSGCKPAPDETKTPGVEGLVFIGSDDKLVATWAASDSEKYIITSDTFESVDTYKGNNLCVKKDTDTSGTIFVKYTVIPDWSKGQNEEPTDKTGWMNTWGKWYPSNTELVGKWYAISYKNLTESSISLAGAFKATGKKGTDTLKEAVEEFTIDNGYFGDYSECTKK